MAFPNAMDVTESKIRFSRLVQLILKDKGIFYTSCIPLMKTCYLQNTGNYIGNIVTRSSQGIVKVVQIKRCDKHAAQM